MKFDSVEQVVEVLKLDPLTPDQYEMVWTYIVTGQRPPAGCYSCSEGYIRRVTGDMDNA